MVSSKIFNMVAGENTLIDAAKTKAGYLVKAANDPANGVPPGDPSLVQLDVMTGAIEAADLALTEFAAAQGWTLT
jgi:hypothetical protein